VYSIADEKRAEAIALIKLSKTLSDKAFPGAVFFEGCSLHATSTPDSTVHLACTALTR
jgi:hypothetical protein